MVKVKSVQRLVGAQALAAELGVSRWHLYKVLHGERKSQRIEGELKARGIQVNSRQLTVDRAR